MGEKHKIVVLIAGEIRDDDFGEKNIVIIIYFSKIL